MTDLQDEESARESTRRERPTAASVIAELWNEREQARATPPPTPPPTDARPRRRREKVVREAGPRDGGDVKKVVAGVVAVALLLGAALGVVFARQGGGMSKDEYVRKADALCAPANALVVAAGKPSSYPDLATASGKVVTATDDELTQLRKLKAPGGATRTFVENLLASIAQTKGAGRGLQDAANAKDDAATSYAAEKLRSSAAGTTGAANALGFTACGSGMQPGIDAVVGGAGGIVKTAFVAKADTLCRAGARAMAALRPPRTNKDPRVQNQDFARYLGEFSQISEKLVADLKALPVPPGDGATISDIMSSLDKADQQAKDAQDAALSNDASRFAAIEQEATVLGTAVDAKLDAYGLTSCGSNFGSVR